MIPLNLWTKQVLNEPLFIKSYKTSQYLKKILQALNWETYGRAMGEGDYKRELFGPWNMYIKVPTISKQYIKDWYSILK